MSNSLDNINGWELFSTPFSSPVRTATAPPRQQAGRPQQKPPKASQHNTTPTAAQRNLSSTPTPTAPQPARQVAAQQKPSTVKQSEPAPSAPVPASDNKPVPKAPTPAPVQATPTKHKPAASPKTLANTQPAAPQKELMLDMSSGSGTAPVDDTSRRKAHKEAEAKHKAEWEAKQAAKKQAEEAALQKLNTMSDADIIAAAAKRVSTDTERLTRRNMKECVAEHIQALCKADTVFARKAMHPRKTMIKCFKYINRMARDYVKQEMEDNDIKPDGNGYGCDVPDGLCYQWAEAYFNDANAPEDQEKEEKFTPKPYTGTPSKTAKSVKKSDKKPNRKQSDSYEQMSLEGVMG